MSRQEKQKIRDTMWRGRWQKCQESGVKMAAYARREGFDAQTAYRWRRLCRLEGRWIEAKPAAPSKAVTIAKPRALPCLRE